MGGCSSTEKSRPSGNRSQTRISVGHNFNDADDIRVESKHRYDEQIVNILKKDLQDNPQVFLLNNILMATQFFENFHRDISRLANSSTSKMEKELNRMLLKDETMECTNPDVIFDTVNKNVRFRPLHGPKKHHSEPLAAKRLYVINDTIEVVNSMDIPQYTTIDKPAYQVRTEESKRKGFLRLKQIDANKLKPETYVMFHSEAEAGPSWASDSDIYEYSTITDIKTPKPLDIMDNPERRDTLPGTCFSARKVKKLETEIYSGSDEEEAVEMSEEDFYDSVTYIDSKGFMNYFKNAIFPNSLGRTLGFDELAISEAKAIPGKIFCNLTDDDDNPITCEVIPSVAIEWPAEQTFEFIMREERPTITDRRTGYRYRWPTDEMLKDIKSMNCVLVPKGYWLKKGDSSDGNIEWEIAFPKAERYIETRMSHAQIRCFLFLLSIHKTFIEPVSLQHGLLTEHIRCQMYWECEANYRDWPEHRLGTKLMKVITNLTNRLSKGVLPDYFIKQKNLFENIPKKYLQFAQRIFHEVLQSPAIYFIRALRNLRYTSGKFYLPLDFKELYKIVAQSQGIKIINPTLLTSAPPLKKKKYYDADTQLKHIQELRNKQKIFKKKLENSSEKHEERKDSIDSIDLRLTCEKQFDVYKTKAILQLFINNFIDIAKKSARISTKDQTLFYLKQAWYLTKILEDAAAAFAVEVSEYREIIYREEEACKKVAVKEISDLPPSTPMRNSVQFDFSLQQQVKSNLVNLNNLNNTFNNSMQLEKAQSFNKVKKERLKAVEANGHIPRKNVAFAGK